MLRNEKQVVYLSKIVDKLKLINKMEIHEIKQRLSIYHVLQYYSLEVKNNHIHCPFHKDKTPSMRVYGDSNSVYCFSGNCDHGNKVIDVIDFVLLKESEGGQPITKHQALLKCKEMLGSNTTNTLQNTFTVLQNQLPNSKKAVAYLQERGLQELKEIGSNHRNGNNTVAYKYPHLKNCLIFPLKNKNGSIVSLYGRSFTVTKQNRHFYLKDRQGLYPNYPSRATQHLILTESVIDAKTLELHANLPTNTSILACYGTNGFTQEHSEAVSNLPNLETITIFFDGDTAGRTASKKLATQLQQVHPTKTIQIVATPSDEDINSLWTNNESTELFTHYLQLKEESQKPKVVSQKSKEESPKTQEQPTNNQEPTTENQQLTFTVKGQVRNLGDSLKVTLQTSYEGKNIIQKLDLFDYAMLEKQAKLTAKALHIEETILLEKWQGYALQLEQQQTPKEEKEEITIDKATQTKCISFLKSTNLLQRFNDAIGKTGVVGETDNRLLLFLIATSYHSTTPLHGLIQGSSGSGKTKLLQSIYKLIPNEAYKSFTRVTESSFYNYTESSLTHKLLCFEDIDGLKEEALLALRELQSNGRLVSSTSQKLESGKIQSMERVVNGPIASLSCTTRADVYEDNISRCFVIAIDESVAQTKNIIHYQNQLAKGTINTQEQQKIRYFVQNCIRLLHNTPVVNPYADKIQLPQNTHKLRRLHGMYQNLVAQVTWLHQYQRKKDNQGRLITQKEDLQLASSILLETIVLKVDELHGSLRQFYEKLKEYIKDKGVDTQFTRFDVKQATGLGKSQINNYLQQLVSLEYIQQFGYANRGYKYKISYWDDYKVLRSKIQKDLQRQLDNL